jgi:hypothetical protein
MSTKIGIYEFNQLPFNEQTATVNAYGRFLTNAKEGDMRYNLYFVNDFYVETSYKASENRIVDFSTFKKGDRINRYLDWIDLNEMLE